jgi:hypothetical protein
MSIDDLTLTDLTIVKTQMLRLKFIVTLSMRTILYMVHE